MKIEKPLLIYLNTLKITVKPKCDKLSNIAVWYGKFNPY